MAKDDVEDLTAAPNRGSAAAATQLPEAYVFLTPVENRSTALSAVRRVD